MTVNPSGPSLPLWEHLENGIILENIWRDRTCGLLRNSKLQYPIERTGALLVHKTNAVMIRKHPKKKLWANPRFYANYFVHLYLLC